MNKRQLTNLLKLEFIGEFPALVKVNHALKLFHQDMVGRYYIIHWWGDYPSGYTRFMFAETRLFVPPSIKVMKMNPQDTAMDVPTEIASDEWIIVHGLEFPESPFVYRLKSYPNRTFNSAMGNFSGGENG